MSEGTFSHIAASVVIYLILEIKPAGSVNMMPVTEEGFLQSFGVGGPATL